MSEDVFTLKLFPRTAGTANSSYVAKTEVADPAAYRVPVGLDGDGPQAEATTMLGYPFCGPTRTKLSRRRTDDAASTRVTRR
jgi:hypothetical protein